MESLFGCIIVLLAEKKTNRQKILVSFFCQLSCKEI